MTKLILSILLSFCLVFSASAWNPMVVTSGSSGSACDTSNVIFWWRGEAFDFTATDGTQDYSAASPAGTTAGGIAIGAVGKYGNGVDVPTASDYVYYTTPSATLDDEGKFLFWFRMPVFVDTASIFQIYGGASNAFTLTMVGTDDATGRELRVSWRYNGSQQHAVSSTTADLAEDTWYVIEVNWKPADDTINVLVDNSSVIASTTTITAFTAAVETVYFGNTIAVGSDYHMDNLIISTSQTDDLYSVCKDELEWPE